MAERVYAIFEKTLAPF